MSVAAASASAVRERPMVGVWRIAQSAVAVSVGLYAVAFAFRLWAIGLVPFPLTEGSAYYVAVARNLVAGRGLVIDAIWSYATAPLTLPRPAFELWQPSASFVAAVPMAVFGPTFAAAQLGGVALGALLAPLAWMVGRDTARRLDLPECRAWFVAVGAGVLAAVCGPFLLSAAVPDSTLPFTVFGVAACVVMPMAVARERRAIVALGVLLGLAYLTRLEAVWVGLALVTLVAATRPGWRTALAIVAPVVAVAAVVALPWWLRNLHVFGSAFPGQIADNVFLTRNEQIYSYLDRPTVEGFVGQGLPAIVGNVTTALWHDLVNVLLVPAAPVVAVGLATLAFAVAFRTRVPAAIRRGSLAALLISGTLIYVATSVLFPVATIWGTFEHAAGPLLIGLAVAAVVGGDALVAWLGRVRGWQRNNDWMAPAALLILTLSLAALQLRFAAAESLDQGRVISATATGLAPALADAGVTPGSPVITDRPVWLSDALGRPAVVLPDEQVSSVLALAQRFGAQAVVVFETRGAYPQQLRTGPEATCFTELDNGAAGSAAFFVIKTDCRP